MSGMWFHAIQLLKTFIPSRKFVYLLLCSAVDIQPHSFTVHCTDSPSFTACCQAISPEVDTLLIFFVGKERVNKYSLQTSLWMVAFVFKIISSQLTTWLHILTECLDNFFYKSIINLSSLQHLHLKHTSLELIE